MSLMSLRMVDIEGKSIEVCDKLSTDPFPCHKITLTLSKVSEMSFGDGLAFMVHPKLEVLNQTNNLLKWIFACKGV